MSDPIEYELSTAELALVDELFTELKENEIHNKALNYVKARIKELATDADFLTVDGVRILQITRTYPARFDQSGFKNYDPRTYKAFVRPSDAPVVSLRVLKGKP